MRSKLPSGLFLIFAAVIVQGADFYASPDGRRVSDGTRKRPWPLHLALQEKSLQPGDTLWLRGGHYSGPFVVKQSGSSSAPVVIRAFEQERVTIDGGTNEARTHPLTIEGRWVTVRDLEVIHTATWLPEAQTPVAVQCKAPYIKLINLIIHDAGQGIGAWMEASALEVTGCLIYHNGQRALEHGIYAQNDAGTGTKTIHDNIIFNNAGFGIHAYTQQGQLSGFDFQGNILFNNGSKQGGDTRYDSIFVGGEPAADRIVARSNYTFFSEGVSRPNLRFSTGDHQARPHGKLLVADNYIVGGIGFTAEDWQEITFTNNVVVNWAARLTQTRLPFATKWSAYNWNFNRYYGPAVYGVGNQLHWGLDQWQRATSLDLQSHHTSKLPPRNEVFVRPNAHEPSRAHIVAYNWEGHPRVAVSLNHLLRVGQSFEIRNAQDYFGRPVISTVFDGQTVLLPTTNLFSDPPRGGPVKMPVTGPLFNVYVLLGREPLESP